MVMLPACGFEQARDAFQEHGLSDPARADDDGGEGLLDCQAQVPQNGPLGKGEGEVPDADQMELQPVSWSMTP